MEGEETMKILLCDDNIVFCKELERHLETYEINHRENFHIKVVTSGDEVIECMKQEPWDVVFLDIEMPSTSGVEVGMLIREQLKNYNIRIIYVSAKSEYAMDLFRINTFDFLIKPVKYEDIAKVMDKLIVNISRREESYLYQKKGQTVRVKLENILYFESNLKKIQIVMDTGKDEFYSSLRDVYEQLKDKRFFLCHKSILVNYDRVSSFYYDRLEMDNGEELEISQAKRKEVRQLLSEMWSKE